MNCIHKCIWPIKGEIRLADTYTHTHIGTTQMQTRTVFILLVKSSVSEFECCTLCVVDAKKDPFLPLNPTDAKVRVRPFLLLHFQWIFD